MNSSFKHREKILSPLTTNFLWLFGRNSCDNSWRCHNRCRSWPFSSRCTSWCTACGWFFFVNEIFKIGTSGFFGGFDNDWCRCSCYFCCCLAFTLTLLLFSWLIFFTFLALFTSTLLLWFCFMCTLFVLWLIRSLFWMYQSIRINLSRFKCSHYAFPLIFDKYD